MLKFIVCCAIILQLGKSLALPGGVNQNSDSEIQNSDSDVRYAAPYEITNEDYSAPPALLPFLGGFNHGIPNHNNVNDFFPQYFYNFENLLRNMFNDGNAQLALAAAQKAFDMTSNAGFGHNPSFDFRFPEFPPMPMFPPMPNFENTMNEQNSAVAFGAIGPGYTHQIASINPNNPAMKNVNVMNRFSEKSMPAGFKSVSTYSSSMSHNVNGRPVSSKIAETVINDNGKVTKYSVHS